MEHIIYSHIADHLERNNIFTARQHGFRRSYSCKTPLVTTIDDWAKPIDKTQQTDVMALDFSKAFDVVAHQRLLSKLSSCGIPGNVHTWVANCLMNRQQRVVVNGEASGWVPVSSDAPQETVLCTLHFLIYINDITECISSEIRLFPVDCLLYRVMKSTRDCEILQ